MVVVVEDGVLLDLVNCGGDGGCGRDWCTAGTS